MNVVRLILLCGHLAGLALLLGGFLIQLRGDRRLIPAMVTGAWVQLVTGFLLVGARELADLPVDRAKVITKLVVSVAVVVLAMIGRRRLERSALFFGVGVLTIVNVLVAVFWT